jgi:hypothetical protein
MVVILSHEVEVDKVFDTKHGGFEWTLLLRRRFKQSDDGNNTTLASSLATHCVMAV